LRDRIPAMRESSKAAVYFLLMPAYLLTIVSFALFGAFLWRGPFPVARLDLTTPQVLAFDALLAFAFFLQHSGMVRRSFRARLTGLIPAHTQGALYAVVSSIVLLLLPVLWQPARVDLIVLHGALRWLVRAVFLAAVAGMIWGITSLKHFDAVGAEPLLARLGAKPAPAMPLTIRGAYRWVRHPIYSSLILMVWASPDVTADRLLFNVLWSAWMIVATRLEERDLAADFGDGYRDYQRRVPMLVPHSLWPRG
jgi:methanethiol S-methyltransferase